jgi:AmmeMemoRadiSam system protein B
MAIIRPAAVAGTFYPASPDILGDMIKQNLAQATIPSVASIPKVLIVPHAGYIYSGLTAASAFVLLEPYRLVIKRVVIIGPSHRVGFSGAAISSADDFVTPLGAIPIDKEAQTKILKIADIHIKDEAHAAEHSLEVQLPFLQIMLDNFVIVPIVVGDAAPQLVSKIIETLWGDSGTLIVISSDLSHYHQYQTAQQLDQATSQAILSLDVNAVDFQHACGCVGIRGLLTFCTASPFGGYHARFEEFR